MRRTPRLAIVATHPVQYDAPWFAHLELDLRAQLEVFYLWDFGAAARHDRGFDLTLQWDVDLLTGYAHRFVRNQARDPGTHHFFGLRNRSLVRELADWKPDAILLFGYRHASHLRVLFAPRLRRIPLLFRGDSHLLAEGSRPRPVKRVALNFLFRRFAAFLPVGRANAGYFLRHGVPHKRLFPAPRAVDNARFSASAHEKAGLAWRRELGIAETDRVVLFAGKFECKKRPDLLLRAFRSASPPRAVLLFVGSGPLGTELRRLAADCPAIRFAPFQNQAAMPRVHAAADLLVLPSQGPGETWGLIVNEACCAGRAVIVSDHVGCHGELVRHGENGLVFSAGNETALREALLSALADDARLRAWGAASRRMINAYSFAAATEGLRRALDFALAERRA
jgi:glycosyltransferase involved in cell wall biosynthesis